MNELPMDWKVEEIGNVCEIHDAKRIPLNTFERKERKGKYPYYGANNIQDFIDEFIFDFDSVLLAEDGGYFEEYESRNIAQYAKGKYWVNNHAHILTGRDCLDTKFLYYSLVHKNICPWINTGTRSKLNQADLRQIKITIPPLPEQKKIVEILSGIDHLLKIYNEKFKKDNQLKKGVLNYLLHRGIQNKNLKKVGFEEIPENWEIKKIEDLTINVRDGNYGSDYPSAKEMLNHGVPFLTSKVIGEDQKINYDKLNFISKKKHKLLSKAHIKKNDVLFTNRGANVGNVALVEDYLDDANIGPQLTLLRVNKKLDKDFLYYSMQSNYFKLELKKLDSGSAMNFFGISTTKALTLRVPPINEQIEISSIIKSIDVQITTLKKKIENIKNIKKGIISELLSGRKRINI